MHIRISALIRGFSADLSKLKCTNQFPPLCLKHLVVRIQEYLVSATYLKTWNRSLNCKYLSETMFITGHYHWLPLTFVPVSDSPEARGGLFPVWETEVWLLAGDQKAFGQSRHLLGHGFESSVLTVCWKSVKMTKYDQNIEICEKINFLKIDQIMSDLV